MGLISIICQSEIAVKKEEEGIYASSKPYSPSLKLLFKEDTLQISYFYYYFIRTNNSKQPENHCSY